LLDTVIQENADVSIPEVRSVDREFPAQALLLIKRVPRNAAESTLRDWALGSKNRITDARARAAAMLLAEKPDPSFVYEIANGVEQHLTVHIMPSGMGIGGSIGSSCGDSGPRTPDPHWPVVYDYTLTEHDEPMVGPGVIPIVSIGQHSIGALRLEIDRAGGGCSRPRSDAEFRHELIAYWLGMKPDAMPWQAEDTFAIVWATQSAYQRELGRLVDKQRAKMLDTFEQLRERGLLDRNGAGLPDPHVVVTIQCEINPCPLSKAQ
jgi:hypothetical protein